MHTCSQIPINVAVGLDNLRELISIDDKSKYRYRFQRYPRIFGASRATSFPITYPSTFACVTRVFVMHVYGFVSSDAIRNGGVDVLQDTGALLSSDNPLELGEFATQPGRFIAGLTMK